MAKIVSIRLFLSIAAIHHRPLHQLDIKNAFLLGDLIEEVYMEWDLFLRGSLLALFAASTSLCMSSNLVWQVYYSAVRHDTEWGRSLSFYHHSAHGCIYLFVYVNNIVIIGSDHHGISQVKQHLSHHFQTKDLGKFQYFFHDLQIPQVLQLCLSRLHSVSKGLSLFLSWSLPLSHLC